VLLAGPTVVKGELGAHIMSPINPSAAPVNKPGPKMATLGGGALGDKAVGSIRAIGLRIFRRRVEVVVPLMVLDRG
jgi:hypothetical protein